MEKSQTPTGQISIGLQLGGASLETRKLSRWCLRYFRLALLPVLDPLYLFIFQKTETEILIENSENTLRKELLLNFLELFYKKGWRISKRVSYL